MFDNLLDKLEEELKAMDKKVASGQELDEREFKCIDTWAHTLKSLETVEAMESYDEQPDEYRTSRAYDGGRSAGRGGSYRRSMYPRSYRRDGRGYSYGDDAMEKLQEAYDNAASEQERKMIRKIMDRMDA